MAQEQKQTQLLLRMEIISLLAGIVFFFHCCSYWSRAKNVWDHHFTSSLRGCHSFSTYMRFSDINSDLQLFARKIARLTDFMEWWETHFFRWPKSSVHIVHEIFIIIIPFSQFFRVSSHSLFRVNWMTSTECSRWIKETRNDSKTNFIALAIHCVCVRGVFH